MGSHALDPLEPRGANPAKAQSTTQQLLQVLVSTTQVSITQVSQ